MLNNYKQETEHWLTDGPTIAWPARGRTIYWCINIILFALLCMFSLRIQMGTYISLKGPYAAPLLTDQLLEPLNVFNFPSQLLVASLIMTLMTAVPILIAQLFNFTHSVPFLLAVFFLAHNQVLSLCLLASCAAVSFEPMRFKSRFVAAVCCLLPVILYWFFFRGDNPESNVLRWAVLYSPWAAAFLGCVLVFAFVMLVGHFLRYRAGVIMPIFALLIAFTVMVFRVTVGMEERDFQAQVYQYSPSQISEFQDRSIVPMIERESQDRLKQQPYRDEASVKNQLRMEWCWAFRGGSALPAISGSLPVFDTNPISMPQRTVTAFYQAKFEAIDQISNFISKHQNDRREPDALYYQALLIDLNADQFAIRDDNLLSFKHDYPSSHSRKNWQEIVDRFSANAVSIEARRRLAVLTAARKPINQTDSFGFAEAQVLLEQAAALGDEILQQRQQASSETYVPAHWMESVFSPPPPTVSNKQIERLKLRIENLGRLIGNENRTGHFKHNQRLAEFAGLNPYQLTYEGHLNRLISESEEPDPLLDNLELALIKLIRNLDDKIARLNNFLEKYDESDSAPTARMELALAMLDQRNNSQYQADRQLLLNRARQELQKIIEVQGQSMLAQNARELLKANPPK